MKRSFGIGRGMRKLVYRLIDVGMRILARWLRPDDGYVYISHIQLSDGTVGITLSYQDHGKWVGFFDSDETGFTVEG